MAWDLNCLSNRVSHLFDMVGTHADVTFKRIDDVASGTYHEMYRERSEAAKVYHTWLMDAVVDENPKQNKKGAMGAEITQDIDFTLYRLVAKGGTMSGSTYIPEEKDLVDYRSVTYEVTRVERILPSGADSQLAFRVMARRYR